MAMMANPYRGSEFGFPKPIPETLPASGFEGWLVQEGYPASLLESAPPGFPEGTPFFCSLFNSEHLTGVSNPDSPNYKDPYDPANQEAPVPETETVTEVEVAHVMTPFEDSGASRYEHSYTTPSTAVEWAGFASSNSSIYPLSFPNGGSITLTASSQEPASIRFVFENEAYPNNTIAFETAPVTVSGPETDYVINIPARPEGEAYNVFLMFIDTRDVPVTITELAITA